MSAVGNYEVISRNFSVTGNQSFSDITVSVPPGKVALGWGARQLETGGGLLNRDLVINGWPSTDGTAVTFQFYETQLSGGAVGTLYVTCAEMGC